MVMIDAIGNHVSHEIMLWERNDILHVFFYKWINQIEVLQTSDISKLLTYFFLYSCPILFGIV